MMANKIISVITMASEIKYSNFQCPMVTHTQAKDLGTCYQQTCSKCIFNGLSQPNNTILETLFKDIENES